MANVPSDSHWYVASIVEELKVEDCSSNVVAVSILLVLAQTPEDAFEKAIELGKQRELSYYNTEGKKVTTIFRGIRDLNLVYDTLEHGAELMYYEQVGVSTEQIRRMVSPKTQLEVFRALNPRPFPNTMPSEIDSAIERQTGRSIEQLLDM